jgi:RNA polymerase sigma factor (sigma-70 family)
MRETLPKPSDPDMGAPPTARADDFESFFHAEHRGLYQALVLACGSREEAEDVLQDAFARVWRHWGRVSLMDNPGGYLHRTAFNVFLSSRRRLSRGLALGLTSLTGGGSDERSTETAVESRLLLLSALGRLPPRQRAAVVLVDVLGYTSGGAAEILGVREGTVRTLASRARASLRSDQSLGGLREGRE